MTARAARGLKKKRKPARKGVFQGKPPGGLRGDRALHTRAGQRPPAPSPEGTRGAGVPARPPTRRTTPGPQFPPRASTA